MTNKPFKYLKACPPILEIIDWTNVWMSPKYDGIRALIKDGVVMSKNLLPIPSQFVQRRFGNRPELEGIDGELILGSPTDEQVYNKTLSFVMAKKDKGEADITLFAYDRFSIPTDEYFKRYETIRSDWQFVEKVPQLPVTSLEHFYEMEKHYVELGYEGNMMRAFRGPNSFYKYGHATPAEGTLMKCKRLEDFEAQIIGFEEQMKNNNEAKQDAYGHTKRSSHKENKTGKGTLGKLLMRTAEGVEFKVGILKGYTDKDRLAIWENQEFYLNQWCKCQKLAVGEKNLPRHPRVYAIIGFRDPIDM